MNHQKMKPQDIDALRKIVGDKQVLVGDAIASEYAHDEMGTVFALPEVLVMVKDKHQVMAVMLHAYAHYIPVTVRGSGTGLVGACVPLSGGILLDMTGMNRIIELDKDNLTLRVEPGVLLLDIASHVEKEGLFYAPDPGEKTATIGGNIATNAGGMRAVKYGVTRDWVRGLDVVLADGSLVHLGGKVVKNSTGYALKDLIIGSEGTLGIIVEATLRLMPMPQKNVSLLVPFKDRMDAIKAAPRLLSEGPVPTAVEFFEHELVVHSASFLGKNMPHPDYDAYLLISYDADSDLALDQMVAQASARCVDDLDAIDVLLVDTEERKTSVWSARSAFLEAIKSSTPAMDECDVVLPRASIGTFLAFVRDLAQQLSVRIPYFGHVGDGNLHLYVCKDNLDDDAWKQTVSQAFDAMYAKAAELGGLVSGEHGIGHAKMSYMARQLGTTQLHLMRGIKKVFDPRNILNPGKIVDFDAEK